MTNQRQPIADGKRRTKTRASSTEPNLPTLTTAQVLERLGLTNPHRLYSAIAEQGRFKKEKWLVLPTGKRNSWHLYKVFVPRPQKPGAEAA